MYALYCLLIVILGHWRNKPIILDLIVLKYLMCVKSFLNFQSHTFSFLLFLFCTWNPKIPPLIPFPIYFIWCTNCITELANHKRWVIFQFHASICRSSVRSLWWWTRHSLDFSLVSLTLKINSLSWVTVFSAKIISGTAILLFYCSQP